MVTSSSIVSEESGPTDPWTGGTDVTGRRQPRRRRSEPLLVTPSKRFKMILVIWTLAIIKTVEPTGVVHDTASDRQGAPIIHEYCQWETFNATCSGPNEVVIVTAARYGRMRVGRCLPVDYYVGCFADVLEYVEQRCSGRTGCTITMPDAELFRVQPCRKDLVAYFEAAYRCVTVSGLPSSDAGSGAGSSGGENVCKEGSTIGINAAPNGYLISPPSTMSTSSVSSNVPRGSTSTESHAVVLGSQRCPWLLLAPPGQWINVTLFDFTSLQQSSPSLPPSSAQPKPGAGPPLTHSGANSVAGSHRQSGHHEIAVGGDAQSSSSSSLSGLSGSGSKLRQHGVAPAGSRDWCPIVAQFREDSLGLDVGSDGSRPSPTGSHAGSSHGAFSQLSSSSRAGEMIIRTCDSRARKRVVYESKSNRLRVILPPLPTIPISGSEETGTGTPVTSQHMPVYVGSYVLYFEVRGCADLVTPENAWIQRRGDTLQVACNFTAERWHLVCKGNDWIGAYGNCSGSGVPGGRGGVGAPSSGTGSSGNQHGKHGVRGQTNSEDNHGVVSHLQQFPFGLLVAIAIGAVVGIIVGCIFLLTVFTFRKRLNHSDLNQSPIAVGTGCYDDMALNAGGGLVLLNHDSSIGGGYGMVSGGDCLLTSGGGGVYQRESNAYKTTADLLQLCGSTAGYRIDHGGCVMPTELGSDPNSSPHAGRYISNAGGIYATATYRYGSRSSEVPTAGGAESDDTGFLSTTCTCGYDECRHRDLDDSTSTTVVSSEADLLQQQQQQPPPPQPASSANDAMTAQQVCFSDELLGRKLLYGRCTSDGYRSDAPSTDVHGPSASLYDWVPAGNVRAQSAAASAGDPIADRAMRTFRGSHATKNQSTAFSSGSASTLPRGGGPVCMVSNAGSGGYDSGNYRALGVVTSNTGS